MPTLNCIGKEAVVEHHRRVRTRLLECDATLSAGDPEAENLLVEGDKGVHARRAVYLLYNGVLGDKRPAGGNVLTGAVLAALPPHPDGNGPRIVYGEACRPGEATLDREGITFRHVPYALREA